MAQVIKIKRRIGSAGAPSAAQLTAGELAYQRTAAAGAAADPAGDRIYVGDGVGVHEVAGPGVFVALQGNQNIAGVKTFGVLPSFPGGGAGNVLTTDGSGVLSWVATPPATVLVDDPITGTGATGFELTVTPASAAQIITGTDNVFPVSSAGLRGQLGAAASAVNLGTDATTIVPAIHELAGKVVALTGAIIVVGNYNATTHQVSGVRPPASPGLAENAALPAPAAANRGWLFLVNVAGTAIAPAPATAMAVGDWVVSNGAAYVHLSMGLTSIAAGNVSFTTIAANGGPGISATTVQAAINAVYTMIQTREVEVDGDSIIGTGLVGGELEVATVDAGTF